MQLLWTVVSYLLKKMLNMELLKMISIVFMEIDIPEIYSRFDEYLAI